ncbi:hypothetical protein FUA48_12480 [Flavobacterium alkalisoli]|uniref:Quinol oxidase subunit 4 n=1 Tax=Flavobacterium alkalisoli TaxID=2602769 RepID=A0A5B9FTT4_9FLAO|nr:hypothetical protein [Flavobacterium alkalisoli]QEE50365.1 hypothetical protein FUA48_12480 [Flavobacterium alkalisoli]
MKRTLQQFAAPISAMLLLMVVTACSNITHNKTDDGNQENFKQEKKLSEAPDMNNELMPAKPKV